MQVDGTLKVDTSRQNKSRKVNMTGIRTAPVFWSVNDRCVWENLNIYNVYTTNHCLCLPVKHRFMSSRLTWTSALRKHVLKLKHRGPSLLTQVSQHADVFVNSQTHIWQLAERHTLWCKKCKILVFSLHTTIVLLQPTLIHQLGLYGLPSHSLCFHLCSF